MAKMLEKLARGSMMLLGAFAIAAGAGKVAAEGDTRTRVLFVGNSLTYGNDLPNMVVALAALQGLEIEALMQAEPDHSLSDHLEGTRLGALLRQDWDLVVLQQGPSAMPSSRRELRRSVARIARKLEGRDTRIALLSAWPQLRHADHTEPAHASHVDAARRVGACVFPAARAWKRLREADASAPLYQADGLHATPLGSLLAAAVIVRGLGARTESTLLQAPADATAGQRHWLHEMDAAARAVVAEDANACRNLLVTPAKDANR